MADFEKSIGIILKHEGGFVDNPADPGGATNWGISARFIKKEGITAQELSIPDLTPDSIKQMSQEVAKTIYRRFFWDKYNYEQIENQQVATKIFDCSVNTGPKRSHKIVQLTAGDCGKPLDVDGVLGPVSFAVIKSIPPAQFLAAMCQRMTAYYQTIAKVNPKLQIFLKNWLHRAAWVG